ncbi:CDC5 [Mytilus edulis]|uniref:CDC5L n=1 Tax=Mytilus edulis TaxID=6550 RepID=A0A8S3USE3_MYTED|nr:CDC5 [Mytilus edulis]
MESSLAADRTHTVLRVATCHLDEGENKRSRCIALIRSVTSNPDSHLYMQTYSDVLKIKLEKPQIQAFEKMQPICLVREIPIYNKIISEDLKCQDPYITIEQFKLFKKQGIQVGWHSAFLLVWEQCWFDVTFMPAELPVLPKPAALELCIDNTKKKISFHPFLYGLLLEFLWHAKYSSTKEEAGIVLEKMKSSIEKIPHQQQSIGLNFITFCCSIQKDYRSASQYLVRSFKLNPVKENVAYLYIKYIVNVMAELSSNDYK